MLNSAFTGFDLIFSMTISVSLVFGLFFIGSSSESRTRNISLGLFLFVQVAIAIDAIISFSPELKNVLINFSPYIQYSFGVFSWFEAPLLLIYMQSLLFSDKRIKRFDYIHFFPGIAYFLYLYSIYYRFTPETMVAMHSSPELLIKWSLANYLLLVQKIVYGGVCLKLLSRYSAIAKNKTAYDFERHIRWVKILIVGYCLSKLSLVVYFLMYLFVPPVPEGEPLLPHIQHILMWGFICFSAWLLVLCALIYLALKINNEQISILGSLPYRPVQYQGITYTDEEVDKVLRSREYVDIFLMTNLQLEKFAEHIEMSPRTVSAIINQHFKKNFSEFVNEVRIEFARKALSDHQMNNKTVLEISLEAGFNSKSVFNRVFKSTYGVTPTAYRKTCGLPLVDQS